MRGDWELILTAEEYEHSLKEKMQAGIVYMGNKPKRYPCLICVTSNKNTNCSIIISDTTHPSLLLNGYLYKSDEDRLRKFLEETNTMNSNYFEQ